LRSLLPSQRKEEKGMKRILGKAASVLVAAVLVLTVGAASAQGLFYKEVEKDGRIYVFNSDRKYQTWLKSGDMGVAITMVGHGPNGETAVAENETAIDLYNLKHDRPGYVREAPKPAPPPLPPTSIRIGTEGELRFGMLLQGWFVADSSPAGPGTDWLGNNTGQNTFRLRRAEIKMNGRITPAWGFEVMFDPAKAISPQTSGTDGKILQDLAVIFLGLKGHEFALGQKKIYLTEEGVRSSSELWFGERAQVTRTFSDTRQTGFFYKGDFSEMFTLYSAITNGTPANTTSGTNDTLMYTGRLDVKPMKGVVIGVSGLDGNIGGGASHQSSSRVAAHAKYGGYDVPDSKLWAEIEYVWASTEQANLTNLKQDGMYASVLYLFTDNLQLGVRYDWLNNNKDIPDSKTTMWTGGLHWLPKGKNLNLKLEWYNVHQDGRKVNGVSAQSYNEFLLAAQAAF
jgi:hypothetical protein